MPEPIPGSDFGAYRIHTLLGEGGMGRVYRATGPGEGAGDVALKILRPELGADEHYRRRFGREASAAARITSSHVVATIEHGEVDGSLYLAQQFVVGGTLEELVERTGGGLPVADVVGLCAEIAAGLDAIHAAGIIHRDLKPANVLLDEDRNALIADLGLVKDSSARTVLTQMGQTLGSISYMSPEQIRDPSNVDARSDVYALGCVAYECLCGVPPFVGTGAMQIMWAHMREEPPDPREHRTELSEELCWSLGKALEKDPAARPPTATTFGHMLQLAASQQETPKGTP